MRNQLPFVLFGIGLGAVIGALAGMALQTAVPGAVSFPFLLGAMGSYVGMVVTRQLQMRQAANARPRKR